MFAGVRPKHHVVWSDGCAGQFKGARAFYFIARYPGLTNGCTLSWNYFGTGHGKAEWDGAGAVVNSALRQSQLHDNWRRMQNAHDAVSFLNEKMGGAVDTNFQKTGIKEANRFFWEIPKDCMRERSFDCETVKGSQSLHSIYSFSIADPTLLFVRKLSCFCAYCFDFDCTNCVNKSHVEGWELVKLKPGNLNHVRGHMLQCEVREDEQVPDEFEEVFDQDGMADFLRPGDNFAVPAMEGNSEGVEFYILQCSKSKHEVEAAFTCSWGPSYGQGDLVVRGTYYQKMFNGYLFLGSSTPAYIHAHLIVHCKFGMIPRVGRRKGGEVTYSLSQDSLDTIMVGLDRIREDDE
jgi:hypothetical protein